MRNSTSIGTSPAFFLVTLTCLVSSAVNGARAQTVVNPSFEVPVAVPPLNYIEDPPTTAGVGWTFSGPAGSTSESGVQQNGVSGPNAPDGKQVGWIRNLGSISQSITFKNGGAYTLTFKIATDTNPEGIAVDLGGPIGTVTPASSTSFNTVTLPFTTTAGSHTLSFTGAGPSSPGEMASVSIDEVAIAAVGPTPVVPQIISGPKDIDPTSRIKLTGSNFGNSKGKFRIHFPSKSLVHFANTSSNDDLDLDVDGKWTNNGTIESEQIITASPVGSVSEQTVDITVIAADGTTSNTWQAKFHNDAVITSGPKTISHSPKVMLKGWDFDSDPGKLIIHFPKQSFVEFTGQSPHSKSDHITDAKANEWKPSSVAVQVQSITGVVEQTAEISITTKDGRKSNEWKAKFEPLIELVSLPWNAVTVVTCSNQGVSNQCNDAFSGGIVTPFCALDPTGQVFGWYSIVAEHDGCFGLDSDDGTDTYSVNVKNGWKIVRQDWSRIMDNATITPLFNALPAEFFTMNIPWHIGATGGYLDYTLNFTVKGPAGVPFQ